MLCYRPSTTKILSRSSPVKRNFSLLLCCPFRFAKLSLLSWFGAKAGDLWLTWKEQNRSPGAGWFVQERTLELKVLIAIVDLL